MSNKEFLERLKNIDMIYKTDENGNVSEIISCGETYENHFKQLEKALDELEELKKIMGTPIQEIMKRLKKLEYYENEKYKHWNIFFNGAKLEYLLYLEKKGKESFMTSISEELFSKIKEHFNDQNGA